MNINRIKIALSNNRRFKYPKFGDTDITSRFRNWKSASSDDEYSIRTSSSTIEFSEFPAFSNFIDTYGLFPSTSRYDLVCDYDLFMSRINNIRKSFYVDNLQETDLFTYRSFICIGDSRLNCFYYILIKNYLKDTKAMSISITVLFNPKEDSVLFLDKVKTEVFFDLPKFEHVNNSGYLNILCATQSGFELKQMEIKCPEIDFDLNYNKDFKPIHDVILEKLSEDKSKGLVLLHGKAGTGKTNYIRYIINKLKKRVIYIPPNMTNSLSDPNLIKFFIQYSNSVLVIEDAENVLMKRSSNSNQATTNILNLTDGLLSDCTNIQVIATFNTDILNIDEALLRKGRLICKYDFSELEEDITEKLAIKIGSKARGRKVLSDIYNHEDESFNEKTTKIGFNNK